MPQLFTWQKNILKAARTHEVIVLHGNIQDMYLFRDPPHQYEIQFDEMMTRLLSGRFGQILRYDPFSKVHDLQIAAAESFQAMPVEEYGKEGFEGNMDSVMTRVLRDMESGAARKTWLLKYMHNYLPYKSSYSQDEQMRLIAIQRMVENIHPGNRLILCYLSDSSVPVEFSQNAHRVSLVKVPMPDYLERKSYWLKYLSPRQDPADSVKQIVDELAKLTDGLALTALKTVIGMAKGERGETDLTTLSMSQWNQIIGEYKFGEIEDHYARISPAQIEGAEDFFIKKEGIKGQGEAIKKTINMLLRAKTGVSSLLTGSSNAPRGMMFLVGPSGVGKTMLSKKLAKFVFSSEEAFFRFDMSEFQQDYTVSKLIGSPPGYLGYEMGGLLTNAVLERPFAVFLFDEIEKAHPRILDIFLQILSDGRLTDSRGQVAFFSEAIIVFTSNIGARQTEIEQLREAQRSGDRSRVQDHFRRCVSAFFRYEISRPELLNRIGENIVPFNFIDQEDVLADAAGFHLSSFQKRFSEAYRKKNICIKIDTQKVSAFIIKEYGKEIKEFGGRAILNILDDVLLPGVSEKVLWYEAHPTQQQVTLVVSTSIRKGKEVISVST